MKSTMKNLIYCLLLLTIFIISCSKEYPYNPNDKKDPLIVPDTLNIPDTTANVFHKYIYEGEWHYTDYKIINNVGIVKIDTTYPGTLELNVSSDTIKNIPYIQYLPKSRLIKDSLVWMESVFNCRCGARIDISPDDINVKYLFESYPQGQGGPSRYVFSGVKQ